MASITTVSLFQTIIPLDFCWTVCVKYLVSYNMRLNPVLVNNMKPNLVLVSKTILQLLLFCLFLGFFGIPSFNQYQRKETIIVKSELETTGIEAPAVTLQATQNNFGWKSIENGSLWHNFDLYDHCERINMTIEQCVQSDTITFYFY